MPAPRQYHTAYTCYNYTMKNASQILAHLFHPSAGETIERHRCYRRFLASLPKKWQAAVAFLYVKESILYIALRHPGYKMELHYNRDLMKSLLTSFGKLHPACDFGPIRQVIVFNSKFYTPAPAGESPSSIPYYPEHARGVFEIATEDPDLRERFESIKERIRCLKR